MVGRGAYQRVAERPPDHSPPPRTFRTGAPVHTSQGHPKTAGYTLEPVRADPSVRAVQRTIGGPMAEVLTESFCERCGTRYTFESAQPRVKRLKGVKVLSRGLKNFVLSDDSSLDEAMAAARSDTDREITAQQLDAFHQTFNFCMTCRQYTCANCWNEAEGTCLTCAPHLGREILPAPFPNLDPATGLTMVDGANGNGHVHDEPDGQAAAAGAFDLGAWPVSDLMAPDADASRARRHRRPRTGRCRRPTRRPDRDRWCRARGSRRRRRRDRRTRDG